jgi:DNA repair exonuclease SbcCD ATPase subunit
MSTHPAKARAIRSKKVRNMATPNMLEEQDNTRREPGKARQVAPEQGPGNVDKIRDILFGSQMREYESRFSRLEESLRKESNDLKESSRKRFDGLESYLKKELESLETRLKSERDERSETLKQLSREVNGLAESLNRKIEEVQDQGVQAERQLRKDLLQQSQDLTEEIRVKVEQIAATVERRTAELRNDKTDRAALAALFTEVALRLNNEFEIPVAVD